VDENFNFYRAYLRGAKDQQARWKRCVGCVKYNLDDALGGQDLVSRQVARLQFARNKNSGAQRKNSLKT
jgi:predicted metalloendopeptidase